VFRFFLVCGAVSAFISVLLGAFGAHALKAVLSEASLSTFHTANEYQMVHSLALLVLGVMPRSNEGAQLLKFSGSSFLAGIVLFSGSLYCLAITGITFLGAITPLGGLAFLSGWASLVVYAFKSKDGQF